MSADTQFALNKLVDQAAELFAVPMALIVESDTAGNTVRASVGIGTADLNVAQTFCDHVINTGAPLIVPDVDTDVQWQSRNPTVADPPIRFVAVAPLQGSAKQPIGALCLVGHQPHPALSATQQASLFDLAVSISAQLPSAATRLNERYFECMALGAPSAVVGTNEQGEVEFWNPAAQEMMGYTRDEMRGRNLKVIIPPDLHVRYECTIDNAARALQSGEIYTHQLEAEVQHQDGSRIPIDLSLAAWEDDGRAVFSFVARSLSRLRSTTAQLSHMVRHDALTGLPNRTGLLGRVDEAIAGNQTGVLILIDLIDFAGVNQAHGHSVGDHMLCQAGQAIAESLSATDMLARWGGDEFCVYLPGMIAPEQITALCHHFAAHLQQVDRQPGQLNANIGIARFPEDGKDTEAVLACVDFALSRAKQENQLFCTYNAEAHKHTVSQQHYELQLRDALERDEFEVFYQPQFRVRDRHVTGAEALIRWRHPRDGVIEPKDFVPILEHSSLAIPVGNWMLKTACAQASRWRATCDSEFTIAVNLFGLQLKMTDFETTIRNVLSESALPPHALELEITENIILDNNEAILASLRQLLGAGVGIAFDDYGTGYASLSLLKHYPLSRLKIDRSFIQNLEVDAKDRTVVQAVLSLGNSFELDVIAEGVERIEQLELLHQAGCLQAQGYLMGKPMPASQFERQFFPAFDPEHY